MAGGGRIEVLLQQVKPYSNCSVAVICKLPEVGLNNDQPAGQSLATMMGSSARLQANDTGTPARLDQCGDFHETFIATVFATVSVRVIVPNMVLIGPQLPVHCSAVRL